MTTSATRAAGDAGSATEPPRVIGKNARPEDWLVGGGEMGKLVRSMDWTLTPLGPIESWPQSLRTTVSLCLASNFPISIAWGPRHVQIYNDGYWPICGGKHPRSMGQDFTECWASPWPVIGEAFERALAGETSFLENQRMFLDRNGYLEETFFTFSFSPIRDETGGVGGLFHPVTETTTKMLAERRTRALRDLAARAGTAQTSDEVLTLAAETLSEFELDVPFALFYRLDAQGSEARLVAATSGVPEAVALPTVGGEGPQAAVWPLIAVVRASRALHVDDLERRCGTFSCGPYPEPPKTALALPIIPPGAERPTAILVAGVSSRLPLDEAYRAFYDLLAAAVTSAVANARAYEEERRRAEALAEIDRAKTAFFSNVSHEFRTPLTLMLGPLEDELAEQSSPLPPARRERLETAHRNTLRLLKLVNTLLDFSRIEAGRIQASYEPIDLATYTTELASVFRSAIERAGLTLTVDCPPLAEPLYADRDMWEKIVLNLLSNAFKHTFEGGIAVTLRWCGDHAELRVVDSGVGIPAAEVPHLFERFRRVKGARSRTHEGTGIGLALVQELVRGQGGTVRVESEEGKGSTFTITVMAGRAHLPPDRIEGRRTLTSRPTHAAAYVEEAAHWQSDAGVPPAARPVAAARNGGAAPVETPTVSRESRPRILWADDNADMRDYVRRLLADRYDVTAVPDGATALRAALEEPPDLVLSDVMMPGLDGFGLLRELRTDARTRTVPVILLSARAGEDAAVEGLDAGADDYLVKPFSARELFARVHTHLELALVRRRSAEQLEQANRELEAFSYSVSHDLRAPLRAIDGFTRILVEDHASHLDADGRRVLDVVCDSARRMGRLIDDLLAFALLGRKELDKVPVDMAAVAGGVVEELRRLEPDRVIAVDVGPIAPAHADGSMIKQVLVNLIANAWKFTRNRAMGRIEIGCTCEPDETTYFVRDNGAGFDMTYAEKLFGVFQRLHRAEEFEGTGVGLTIVQRIVQRHGGRVWAEGAVDRGATFYFTLPARPAMPDPVDCGGLFRGPRARSATSST